MYSKFGGCGSVRDVGRGRIKSSVGGRACAEIIGMVDAARGLEVVRRRGL